MGKIEELKKERDALERILIIKTNLLGDVLNFLPVANFLRSYFRNARLSWLVSETGYPVLVQLADLDEILLIPDKLLYNYSNLARIASWLRRKNFELIVTSFQEECFLIGLLSFCIGARFRLGYNLRNRGWFFNIKLESSEHRARRRRVLVNADILKLFDEQDWLKFCFVPKKDPERKARFEERLVGEFKILPAEKIVVLHLFSNKKVKSWSFDHAEKLVKRLIGELGFRPVIVGTEEEAKEFGKKLSQNGVVNLTGQIDFFELYYILERAELFIGIDSFPLQLTEFTKTSSVALFGSTDVEENSLLGRSEVVQAKVDCSPCWPNQRCERNYECWRSITSERVLEACERQMERREGGIAQ